MEDDKLNFHFNLNTWFIFICQMNDKILFKIQLLFKKDKCF